MSIRTRRQSCSTAASPITMIPLDVTHQVLSTPTASPRCPPSATAAGPQPQRCSPMFEETRTGRFGRAAALHDPCVIAYLLRPELF